MQPVPLPVTDIDLASDLAAFESELADHLALDPAAQALLFTEAHTANSFSDEPVTDGQLRAVYDLIKWGPTAMNSQPLRIAFLRPGAGRDRLIPHMAEGNQAKTAIAPVVAVLAADLDFHDEFPKTFPVFPGARDAHADETRRVPAAHLSASLQIGYFIVGLRAAGLAAGPMSGFDADGVSQEFFPDGRHRALVVVNIGYPTEESFRPRQPRLAFDEVAQIL